MTVRVYTLMIGLGLSVLTVLACMAMLLGWFFYLDSKLRRSQSADGRPHGLPLTRPGAWGEPDLAPPSTSPVALTEVAELEALWSVPPHRASAGTD
jgi:hypothetical protein